MTAPLYSGEAKILSWGENNTSGRFVRLEIEGGGEHPFRGYEGERFMVVFVPIGNDEKPMTKLIAREGKAKRVASLNAEPSETADAVASPISMGDAPTHEDGATDVAASARADAVTPASRAKKRWHEMPASQRAALLVKDAEFQEFTRHHADFVLPDVIASTTPEERADMWLKIECKINSKRDLDIDPGERRFVRDQFERLEGNFHAWRQAKQHGAA